MIEIAVEQIRRLKPDVVYIQDLNFATRDFLAAVRPFTKLIAGQIASPVPEGAPLAAYDIIFSSFPHFVDSFRKEGVASYYTPLAFDPLINERIGHRERIYDVTFIGGISRGP